jgi:NAD(P)-dependent dehydrogenase (short-subunit alcohol dehydrogenase family)
MQLRGKRALITGGSRGFGRAVAEAFVAEGASVMLCARDADELYRARGAMARGGGAARVLAVPADVSARPDVEMLVETAITQLGGLDVLVCNAAVHGPKGLLYEVDWDDWSNAIDVNLKGVALPCRTVLPHFVERRSGKILILSGGGATKPMPRLSAYAASKAAVVRLAETLADEVREAGIDVNAIAPGAMNTRLLDDILAAGPHRVGEALYAKAMKQRAEGGTALAVGAALCVFLASCASDGITGRLISAVWDPWSTLSQRRTELEGSDIYTLRRIVPEDRGKTWS